MLAGIKNENQEMLSDISKCCIIMHASDSLGLKENNDLVTGLRAHRDNVLMNDVKTAKIMKDYYEESPVLISKLEKHANKATITKEFFIGLELLSELIANKKHSEAIVQYNSVMMNLKEGLK